MAVASPAALSAGRLGGRGRPQLEASETETVEDLFDQLEAVLIGLDK